MKRLSILVLLLALVLPATVWAQTVTTIYGGNVACDPNVDSCLFFPAQGSILCDGAAGNLDCPQWFHPDWSQAAGTRFFGVSNRANPPRYLTSTTGVTWSLMTTQPFVAAVLNFGGRVAVTSSGAVIAASGQGANTCIIRRSTDQGANWTTVFTSATRNCSVQFGNPTPPGIYCTEIPAQYCALADMTNAASIDMVFSTDDGVNWTDGVNYPYVSADSQIWGPIVASDGTGVLTRGVNSTGGAGQPFGSKQAADWTNTLTFIPAVNVNCRPFTMGNTLRAHCRPNAGGTTTRIFSGGALGIAPVQVSTYIEAGVPASGGSQDFMPAGFNGTYGYAITSNVAGDRYVIYISGDGANSFILSQILDPATNPVFGCCRGNFMRWGNKLYWTTGVHSSQAIFGVVQ